jgi:nucleotide-binding universal stress UspA family protein
LSAEFLRDNVIVDVRLAATRALDSRAAELRATGLDVQTSVVMDVVEDGIHKHARDSAADVIVVGTHARQGALRAFLGSVAERTVRGATCPVVVVPPDTVGRLAQATSPSGQLKVVAGVDPSPPSDAALEWLRELGGRASCDISFVHLYWVPREQERLGIEPSDGFDPDPEIASILARELRSEIAVHFGRDDVSLRVRPLWGSKDAPLAWEAESDDADLLVLGTSQGRGSTALATLRRAHVPVACVPAGRRGRQARRISPVRSVLVTTDFSSLGNAAVEEAYRLLLHGGGDVVLLHVAEPHELGREAGRARQPEVLNDLEVKLLGLVPGGVESRGIRTRACVVSSDGAVGEAILKSIRRVGPDVVVMSSHGRTGITRTVRGSVTEHVVRESPKPVLVVPARARAPLESAEDDI